MILEDLCKKYGEVKGQIMKLCRMGELPGYKVKNRWHLKEKDYLAWVALQNARKRRINTRQCKTCIYSMQLESGALYVCDYLGKTGHMRGCPTYPTCAKRKTKTERGM